MKKQFVLLIAVLLMLFCAAAAESHTHTGGKASCDALAVCTECGQTYGHLTDHSWGAWIADDDSTHTRTCQTNAAHKETRYHMGGASSCTEGAKCVLCGTTHDAPLGHVPVAKPGKAPTCIGTGLTDGEDCSRCGAALVPQQVIPARGHSYNTWVPVEGGMHTALCSISGCGAVGTVACQPFEVTAAETLLTVCPICGCYGGTPFGMFLSRSDAALPMGQLLVRGLESPFEGALYAFTVTGSYAGAIVEPDGMLTIALPADLAGLPAFRLVRVDVVPAAADAERTESWTDVNFLFENGELTFTTDVNGLFLLVPAE